MSERIDFSRVSPEGMKALGGVRHYVLGSGLPLTLIELVFLRVSQINGCAYCLDMHTRELLEMKVPQEKITLTGAWREAGNWFTAAERAALGWAEALTLIASRGAPDELYDEVRSHFSEKEIIDLNITIGLMNAYNRLAISTRKLPDSARKLA
ncbi:alkylhydroperoxidase [Izhakiella australiensis]|uniref:Alkylhydroperoxidase n=1 Tax=Izhakiella australiensis TaxID=1926881 RepID=A0A1S8YJY9_9GAMM|nr:carboxymuconolactone decarboxylase family protein [Izhakiella australiensis]OON39198.1 alkylhydroperoxidase [Izhakiella australiensis]